MTDHKDTTHFFCGRTYRVFSSLFGIFLTSVGFYAIFFGVVDPLIGVGVGLVIAALGIETIWSAIHSKQSWLIKLGPFF